MRENSKTQILPTIECDERTFEWLSRLPVNKINKVNLKWREFAIVYKFLDETVLVDVKFDSMNAKVRLYNNYKPERNGTHKVPKGKNPSYQSEVKFVLDRVCITNVKGKNSLKTESFMQYRIVPILRFLMSTEKYEVVLRRKELRNKNAKESKVYMFERTTTAFGETFDFHEQLFMKPEHQLLTEGIVVSVSVKANEWLERTADYVRKEEKEKKSEHNSPVYDTTIDSENIKKVSAIKVYDDSGFFQLQFRHKNDVIEVAYFEDIKKCLMIFYASSTSNFTESYVVYGADSKHYVEDARKALALVQNCLVYLRIWDVDTAQKLDNTWRKCEVHPWPFWE